MYCVYSIIHVASITADREARDTVMKNRKILKLRFEIAMAVYLDSFTIQTIVAILSLLVFCILPVKSICRIALQFTFRAYYLLRV